jgi:hypothetical protein
MRVRPAEMGTPDDRQRHAREHDLEEIARTARDLPGRVNGDRTDPILTN